MKINFITVLTCFVFISLCSCAQNNPIYFKLNWMVGEEKLISITRNAKEFKSGKLTRDTSAFVVNKITVARSDDSAYFIDYRMENDLVKYGRMLYNNIENELTNDSYIVLNYRIDKITLKTQLLNLNKADSLVDNSYNEILKILKSKVPDKLLNVKASYDLLYQELKGFETESCDLATVLLSYNKTFVLSDTLTKVDSLSNPFKLQKFVGAKVKSYVSKISDKTIDITVNKTYDFAVYKLMVKELSDKMMSGAQPIPKGVDQLTGFMTSTLNSVDFDAAESVIISRRLDSSWPLKIMQHTTLSVKDVNIESSVIINATVEIK